MGNEAAVISRVLVQPSERTGQLANTDIFFKAGRVFFGLAIVAFGIQSLFYAHSANPHLIGPPFFPGRLLWAWIAGAIFCAGGVSIAANTNVRLMAALVGVVMAARIVFIHAPMLAANLHDPGPWTSGFEIVGICSGAWALVAHSSAGGRLKQSLMIAVRIGLASLLVVVGVQHFHVCAIRRHAGAAMDAVASLLGLLHRSGVLRDSIGAGHGDTGPTSHRDARPHVLPLRLLAAPAEGDWSVA